MSTEQTRDAFPRRSSLRQYVYSKLKVTAGEKSKTASADDLEGQGTADEKGTCWTWRRFVFVIICALLGVASVGTGAYYFAFRCKNGRDIVVTIHSTSESNDWSTTATATTTTTYSTTAPVTSTATPNSKKENVGTPETANCATEYVTIDLSPLTNMSDVASIYPPGVRDLRCGGFCVGQPGHSCQPSKSAEVKVRVMVNMVDGTQGERDVAYLRHEECSCGCQAKAKDCKPGQIWLADSCKCICADSDLRRECLAKDRAAWDDSSCACVWY